MNMATESTMSKRTNALIRTHIRSMRTLTDSLVQSYVGDYPSTNAERVEAFRIKLVELERCLDRFEVK